MNREWYQNKACFITKRKIEKIMEVIIKTFLPAGRRANRIKEAIGRNIPKLIKSLLELFMGEKNMVRNSKTRIKVDWIKLSLRLGIDRSN